MWLRHLLTTFLYNLQGTLTCATLSRKEIWTLQAESSSRTIAETRRLSKWKPQTPDKPYRFLTVPTWVVSPFTGTDLPPVLLQSSVSAPCLEHKSIGANWRAKSRSSGWCGSCPNAARRAAHRMGSELWIKRSEGTSRTSLIGCPHEGEAARPALTVVHFRRVERASLTHRLVSPIGK